MNLKIGDLLIHKTFRNPTIIQLIEKVIVTENRAKSGFRFEMITAKNVPHPEAWFHFPDYLKSCYDLQQFYRKLTPAEEVLWISC